MGDTSGCQINSQNLAAYLQGVTVTPSSNITSEYFVTGSLPSSASTKRVWQFTTQGKITGPDTATLTLDYTQAHINCPAYNITFEGALNGTFIVKNQVFSANKFMSYQLVSTYVLELTLRIPKTILECFGATSTQNYFFDVNVNDATAPPPPSIIYCNYDASGSGWTVNGSNITINEGSSCSGTCGSENYNIYGNVLNLNLDSSSSPYDIVPTANASCFLVVFGCPNACSSKSCIEVNVANTYAADASGGTVYSTQLGVVLNPLIPFYYSITGDSSGYFVPQVCAYSLTTTADSTTGKVASCTITNTSVPPICFFESQECTCPSISTNVFTDTNTVAVNVTLSSTTTIQNLVFNATNSLENVYLTITNSSSSFIYVYIVNTETGCSSSCELAIPSNGNFGNSATWLSDKRGCFLSYSSSS
jgi:hypothetical protein